MPYEIRNPVHRGDVTVYTFNGERRAALRLYGDDCDVMTMLLPADQARAVADALRPRPVAEPDDAAIVATLGTGVGGMTSPPDRDSPEGKLLRRAVIAQIAWQEAEE